MIGETLSHYRVLEQLGAGGMGVVYKAEDVRLKRPVALKFLPLELTTNAEAKQRLVHEAQTASALDHPNISVIHEIDETPDGRVFIAMAYYKGVTLTDRIARGPLSVSEALHVATQVASGMAAAHAAGIVHRDIKPANIIITPQGEVKLLDFGIAKLEGQTCMTRTGTTLGTVAYMAPEQISGVAADERSDIWAMGVVLYEMLTGRLPFDGDHEIALMNAIVNKAPRIVREVRSDVPEPVERVITQALQKSRGERYASAQEMLRELEALRPAQQVAFAASRRRAGLRMVARPYVAVPLLLALTAAAWAGGWSIIRSRQIAAARATLPEIQRLIEQDTYIKAFELATTAESVLGNDPALAALWPQLTIRRSVATDPSGATLSVRDPGLRIDWLRLGATPLEDVRVPRGMVRWKIEKPGFETVEGMSLLTPSPVSLPTTVALSPLGNLPEGMVPVPEQNLQIVLAGYDFAKTVRAAQFLIDRYEVTNVQFKEFVDAGGYAKRAYWKHAFVRDGRTLSWEEAMREFRDQTERPGPATWEVGTFPKDRENSPVGGVSWYEAAAYAEFRGKSLPTVYHWVTAAGTYLAAQVVPLSNFSGEVRPVGASAAIGPYGLFDAAGNVREWCFNETQPGFTRYILGGGWTDPDYMFTHASARSPFDRSPSNGFRLVEYVTPASVPIETTRPIEQRIRDYRNAKPASPEVFTAYKSVYAYDPIPLEPKIEKVDEAASWRRETVSFRATYGDDRVLARVFLPKKATPPYSTMLFWPGSGPNVLSRSSSENFVPPAEFVIASGRALVVPVYFGTWERHDGRSSSWPETTRAYRDWVVKQVNDARRALDYLESRPEFRRDAMAYFGWSWGSRMAPLVLAQEPRLKTAVLLDGGLTAAETPPEVDPLHFAPHVSMPVLMINGNLDFIYDVEKSQKPLFQLLGTPVDRKRYLVLQGPHGVIFEKRSQVIREILDWLDRHLGPVH